jgi:hypothetical protein
MLRRLKLCSLIKKIISGCIFQNFEKVENPSKAMKLIQKVANDVFVSCEIIIFIMSNTFYLDIAGAVKSRGT